MKQLFTIAAAIFIGQTAFTTWNELPTPAEISHEAGSAMMKSLMLSDRLGVPRDQATLEGQQALNRVYHSWTGQASRLKAELTGNYGERITRPYDKN
jgi:hypothetical protein